ncbi:hypothetical protein HJA58_001654 [Vibrio vulnificus]|nr:hypothetical protein [Vibrio vulnificus]
MLWLGVIALLTLLGCCLLGQVRFQTWHLACVDEWISVRTGMTAGGVAAVKYYIGGNNGW